MTKAPQTAPVAVRVTRRTAYATAHTADDSAVLGRAESAPLGEPASYDGPQTARRPSLEYVAARIGVGLDRLTRILRHYGYRIVPSREPWGRQMPDRMHEGHISTRQLIQAAAEFDRIDDEPFLAADFVAWLLPLVEGSKEQRWTHSAKS